MRLLTLLLALAATALTAVAGADPTAPATAAPAPHDARQPAPAEPVVLDDAADPADEAAAWAAGDCARCHVVPGHEEEPRTRNCATCHQWIRNISASPAARERAMQVFPLWERYERNTRSYLPVPSLAAAMARLDPAWVEGYLADPHDLRPGLPEGMPRFALTAAQRRVLAAAFVGDAYDGPPTPKPTTDNLERGERLFQERGCVACHAFGGRNPVAGNPQSPDLAWTRDRMTPDMAFAWIENPQAVSPHATMPNLGLLAAEALAVRDYILLADLQWNPAPPPPSLPAPTTDPVTWAQVEERVFGRICVHCHMNPDLNEGRAGPGNAGGFGWPATGIELQTYEGVVAASARIPDSLARRAHEAARDAVGPGVEPASIQRPERPGMPLGLPPLSDDDVALVLGWIAQGMPR